MGLFDKVFKSQRDISKSEIVEVPWHQMTELEETKALMEKSSGKTLVVFKHSTRCGISRMVLRQFESGWRTPESGNYQLYFLDLLQHRELSNEVAKLTGVPHESPQVIVIQDRKVVYQASHHSIDPAQVIAKIEQK